MLAQTVPAPLRPRLAARSTLFVGAGSIALLLMLAPALDPSRALTWLETLHCAGIFGGVALAAILFRGPARMALGSTGRIVLAGLFIAAVAGLNPIFQFIAFDSRQSVRELLTSATAWLPCAAAVALWFFAKWPDENARGANNDARSGSSFEEFLCAPGSRFQLAIVALLGMPALALLSGVPLRSALAPLAVVIAVLVALGALLKLAADPWGARALCALPLLASAWLAAKGAVPYFELRAEAARTAEFFSANKPAEGTVAYERAVKLSTALHAPEPRIEAESAIAHYFEANQNPGAALPHWENVAALRHADRNTFLPIQRVYCEMGDSLPPWRRLVYEGFPAIDNPEMAPGVERLGASAPDVRSRLLAALLAWNRQAPEAERRRLLEAVQKVAPGEPSSFNLLKRLKVPVADVPLWLPAPLIVGATPTTGGAEGAIEDLGEVSTIVCLNAGHWEMSLRAAGTPMHEIWPIVRVELNGVVIAATQVNKAAEHDVPFTFDVTRDDIFKLRVVFLNRQDDLEQGLAAHRGLKIAGIKFSRAKD
ncbi:MAG TPA: hypothetical protein VKX17_18645 [Planctomycetota bacterium]|nr:hypothetical protein [Planctomycetota bacterium]